MTAVAVSEANDVIVTGDTSGQMKMWDVSKVNFDDQSTEKVFVEKYFVVAHRGLINQLSVVEASDGIIHQRLVISASNDCNINLHRLDDGVKIGQFGQAHPWNLKDMSQYDGKKPSYVRQWYLRLRELRKKRIADQEEESKKPTEKDEKEEKAKGSAAGPKRAATKDAEKAMIEADPQMK